VKKLRSVQYLRAFSALMVLTTHSLTYQLGDDAPYLHLTSHMRMMLFFVISGFIMVYISGTEPFSALTFLKRRAIRIVPLYWVFTIFTALLAALLPSLFQRTVFTWPHFLESLLFIVHEAPVTKSLSPILSLGWTLNYEIYFYIVFAMVAFMRAGPRLIALSILFISAWLVGLLAPPTNPVLPFYLNAFPLAFAAGTWVGWLFLNGEVTSNKRQLCTLGIAIVASFTIGITFPGALGFAGQFGWAIGLLLLVLLLESKLGQWSLLEKLGDASYSLYLSHIFVVAAVVQLARHTVGDQGATMVTLTSATCIVVACAAALVIHRTIEKPMLHIMNDKRKPDRTTFPRTATGVGERS